MHPLSVFNTAYCLAFNAFKKDGVLQQCAKEVWWIYTEQQEYIVLQRTSGNALTFANKTMCIVCSTWNNLHQKHKMERI